MPPGMPPPPKPEKKSKPEHVHAQHASSSSSRRGRAAIAAARRLSRGRRASCWQGLNERRDPTTANKRRVRKRVKAFISWTAASRLRSAIPNIPTARSTFGAPRARRQRQACCSCSHSCRRACCRVARSARARAAPALLRSRAATLSRWRRPRRSELCQARDPPLTPNLPPAALALPPPQPLACRRSRPTGAMVGARPASNPSPSVGQGVNPNPDPNPSRTTGGPMLGLTLTLTITLARRAARLRSVRRLRENGH